jgi:phage/plasmid-associated DNA primase
MEHCGAGLTPYLVDNKWAVENGITTGGQYLKCWVASVFKQPTEPLPYLFFYSKEQNTGKSIFHEALELLVTRGGIVRADLALGDTQFNGELAGSVICVIEETNLRTSKSAYNKIKDWVTSKHINIRKMYEQPYSAVNTTHWLHCANDQNAVPVFPGDTRITMINVQPLEEDKIIPKALLLNKLTKEAPDFLASLLHLEIPEPTERLAIPIIVTSDKQDAENMNKSILDCFIDDHCHYAPGHMIPVAEFYEKFCATVDCNYLDQWTKIRVGKELDRNKFPKGRDQKNAQWNIGNISWTPVDTNLAKLVLGGTKNDLLVFDGVTRTINEIAKKL